MELRGRVVSLLPEPALTIGGGLCQSSLVLGWLEKEYLEPT